MKNKTDEILVSIIVPVYNMEQYLNKCVDSLLEQTHHNIEIVLVDDGSLDKSPQICDDYAKKDERVKVIHKSNGGLSDARNAGIDCAVAEYLSFIDSDDYLAPEAVEKLLSTAISNQCMIAHMRSFLVDGNYSIIKNESNNTELIKVIPSAEYIEGMCEKRFSESVCDKLFCSELFNGRRFSKGRLNEDFFFLSSMLMDDIAIAEIDYSGYFYYQRHGSITNSGYGKSLIDSLQNAYELKNIAERKKPDLAVHFARLALYQARTIFIVIPWNMVKNKSDDYTKAITWMRECLPYLNQVRLSSVDKRIIKAVNKAPKIAIKMLGIIWKVKNYSITRSYLCHQ